METDTILTSPMTPEMPQIKSDLTQSRKETGNAKLHMIEVVKTAFTTKDRAYKLQHFPHSIPRKKISEPFISITVLSPSPHTHTSPPTQFSNSNNMTENTNPGNFANRPKEEVQEIARKGGQASHSGGFASMDPDKQVREKSPSIPLHKPTPPKKKKNVFCSSVNNK